MALPRPQRQPDRKLQAACPRTSATLLPLAVWSHECGMPKFQRQLRAQRSKRVRFSKYICSSQCRSCQSFKMGQSSFVIHEGLHVFELQVECVVEVRKDMNELLAVGGVGAQCRSKGCVGLG